MLSTRQWSAAGLCRPVLHIASRACLGPRVTLRASSLSAIHRGLRRSEKAQYGEARPREADSRRERYQARDGDAGAYPRRDRNNDGDRSERRFDSPRSYSRSANGFEPSRGRTSFGRSSGLTAKALDGAAGPYQQAKLRKKLQRKDKEDDADEDGPTTRRKRFLDPEFKFGKTSLVYQLKHGAIKNEAAALVPEPVRPRSFRSMDRERRDQRDESETPRRRSDDREGQSTSHGVEPAATPLEDLRRMFVKSARDNSSSLHQTPDERQSRPSHSDQQRDFRSRSDEREYRPYRGNPRESRPRSDERESRPYREPREFPPRPDERQSGPYRDPRKPPMRPYREDVGAPLPRFDSRQEWPDGNREFRRRSLQRPAGESGRDFENAEDRPRRKKVMMPMTINYTTAASQFLYGKSVVRAVLQQGRRKLYRLYIHLGDREDSVKDYDTIAKLAEWRDVPITIIPPEQQRIMDKMSMGRPHNGFVLETSPLPQLPVKALGKVEETPFNMGFHVELDHQTKEEEAVNGTETFVRRASDVTPKPFVLLLNEILDPGNLGAALRTASYLGVDAVGITNRSSATLTPVVLKSAAGAVEEMTIFTVDSPLHFIEESKKAGWKTYAAVPPPDRKLVQRHGSKFISMDTVEQGKPLSKDPCILMLGNEGHGLPKQLKIAADYELSVPRFVHDSCVDSLNVSVAAALLCHAFVKEPVTQADLVTEAPKAIKAKPTARRSSKLEPISERVMLEEQEPETEKTGGDQVERTSREQDEERPVEVVDIQPGQQPAEQHESKTEENDAGKLF